MKKLVIDLDETITNGKENSDYISAIPDKEVIEKLRAYQDSGFEITIFTSRNMRTFQGQIGKINIHTLPTILTWLDKHSVPFDEVIVGKPWCGFDGFYVDDRSIRPKEFKDLSYEEVKKLLGMS
jgi:capsule biosynthesis phosphatase